jgi:transposase-like protein
MESMPSTRRARQEALPWQPADQRDLTLDVPIQSRRNAKAAERLTRKL